jgi:ADP-ribosyl-[dinitrogen reductase] hydrolase
MDSGLKNAIEGCILGTALGDSIGLPVEGLSRQRQQRMYPNLSGHHFLFGRGMVSDDTEHTCIVAEALAASAGDSVVFRNQMAIGLRWWLLALPAGVGLATLRATIRLWFGVPPDRSGVFSAGNGPAMRSALLGVCFSAQREKMREFSRVSARLTHTDPKAEWSAFAVSLAASHSLEGHVSPERYQADLAHELGAEAGEFLGLVNAVVSSVRSGETTGQFATSIGLGDGVSGYCFHSVPVALHAWLTHPFDYRAAVLSAIQCGGDTDTVGAITGAIVGARVGAGGLPQDWLSELAEWPRTPAWMTSLSIALADAMDCKQFRSTPKVTFGAVIVRNLFFTLVALAHGFRRLLPPF